MAQVAKRFEGASVNTDRENLLQIIIKRSLIREGGPFRLASGRTSNYFLDLKKTMLDPDGINLLADVVLEHIASIEADYVGGLALGAVPVVIATVLKSKFTNRPLKGFWVRKEQKDHGTLNLTDGYIERGSNVVIVDDVTTTGGSVVKAIDEVRRHDCKIKAVITIVDRLEGARETLKQKGIELIALFDTSNLPL